MGYQKEYWHLEKHTPAIISLVNQLFRMHFKNWTASTTKSKGLAGSEACFYTMLVFGGPGENNIVLLLMVLLSDTTAVTQSPASSKALISWRSKLCCCFTSVCDTGRMWTISLFCDRRLWIINMYAAFAAFWLFGATPVTDPPLNSKYDYKWISPIVSVTVRLWSFIVAAGLCTWQKWHTNASDGVRVRKLHFWRASDKPVGMRWYGKHKAGKHKQVRRVGWRIA